jgi:hypothetical protein
MAKSPLAKLPMLEVLDIGQTNVKDLTPLLAIKTLRKLDATIEALDIAPTSKNRAALVGLVRRGVEVSCADQKRIAIEAKRAR